MVDIPGEPAAFKESSVQKEPANCGTIYWLGCSEESDVNFGWHMGRLNFRAKGKGKWNTEKDVSREGESYAFHSGDKGYLYRY